MYLETLKIHFKNVSRETICVREVSCDKRVAGVYKIKNVSRETIEGRYLREVSRGAYKIKKCFT